MLPFIVMGMETWDQTNGGIGTVWMYHPMWSISFICIYFLSSCVHFCVLLLFINLGKHEECVQTERSVFYKAVNVGNDPNPPREAHPNVITRRIGIFSNIINKIYLRVYYIVKKIWKLIDLNNGLVHRDVCLVMKEREVLQIVENSAVMQLSVH